MKKTGNSLPRSRYITPIGKKEEADRYRAADPDEEELSQLLYYKNENKDKTPGETVEKRTGEKKRFRYFLYLPVGTKNKKPTGAILTIWTI